MNTTSEVSGVVFKTGSESACMNTTSEGKSAVSVVHRLSEDISDYSSNSSGNGDVTPLVGGDVVTMEEMDGSESWEKFYNVCPLWGYLSRETQDPDTEWPRGLRWEMGRLFFRERLCIPLCLQKPFIRKTHACLGHVGGKRLWEQMSLTT